MLTTDGELAKGIARKTVQMPSLRYESVSNGGHEKPSSSACVESAEAHLELRFKVGKSMICGAILVWCEVGAWWKENLLQAGCCCQKRQQFAPSADRAR